MRIPTERLMAKKSDKKSFLEVFEDAWNPETNIKNCDENFLTATYFKHLYIFLLKLSGFFENLTFSCFE